MQVVWGSSLSAVTVGLDVVLAGVPRAAVRRRELVLASPAESGVDTNLVGLSLLQVLWVPTSALGAALRIKSTFRAAGMSLGG